MKCLTIVITLFLICLWSSILFLDRRPKHCHWDFALIVIVKITLLFLLFLAVWSTRRSPTCFGVIWSVFNSLCILHNSRDKFEDTVNPRLSSPNIALPFLHDYDVKLYYLWTWIRNSTPGVFAGQVDELEESRWRRPPPASTLYTGSKIIPPPLPPPSY